MLERFTKIARETVVDAEAEARAVGAAAVGPEHLLVAALRRCPQLAWRPYFPSAEQLRRRLAAPDPDVDALATIGISLPEVRRAIDEAFGPGVWDAPRGRRRLPFTTEAKHALELALREALELRVRRIDQRVILLGLIREDGPALRLLAGFGIHVDGVRNQLRREYVQLARTP